MDSDVRFARPGVDVVVSVLLSTCAHAGSCLPATVSSLLWDYVQELLGLQGP